MLRLAVSHMLGAGFVFDFKNADGVEEFMRITDGRRRRRPWRLRQRSRLRCACSGLAALYRASTSTRPTFGSRWGLHCGARRSQDRHPAGPGGKERIRRLMDVIASGRVDLTALIAHHYKLDDIENAYGF